MDDCMDISSSAADQSFSGDASIQQKSSRDPATWTVSDVTLWLKNCNLEQFASVFEENEVDGAQLMNDDFDEAMIKDLIPLLKHRVTFSGARKRLRSNAGMEKNVRRASVTDNIEDSKQLEKTINGSTICSVLKSVQDQRYDLVRIDTKAHCKWQGYTREVIRLDIENMLRPRHTIHTSAISNALNIENSDLLAKLFNSLCVEPNTNELDPDFNTLVDEPLNIQILLDCISHVRSLKSYILDSLKRYHSLSDIMRVLSSDIDPAEVDNTAKSFFEIVEKITKYTLVVCTIESVSYESQRFLGNMIRKNGLSLPLAYYTHGRDGLQYKINFNTFAETFCFSNERVLLYLGSPTAIGLGKTSILPYLFENIRSESLNTEGNAKLRFGCIDTMFASLKKNNPYAVFDVHGTMTTINEDLITAIQQYCTIQILFVTEDDLQNGDFIRKTMNYSTETRSKPTIIVVFDPKYGDKNAASSAGKFEQEFSNEKWPNTIWKTAPVFKTISTGSRLNDGRRIQRLRQSLISAFDSLQALIESQPICKSIFAIEAYLLDVKSNSNASPSPLITFEIEDILKSLFDGLSDTTDNLQRVTPVSYLESAKLKCETELTQLWNESPGSLQAQLEQIQKQYQDIDRIPEYTAFFIELLVKRTYIELLITEKYLEQWRSQYEPSLSTQLTKAKNDAMVLMSRVKYLEEQHHQHITNNNQPEAENSANQIQMVKEDYKISQDFVIKSENQMFNIDLTIGLFCDEIYALYEFLPNLFQANNLADLLAKKLSLLMYKGFSFHILRGRPLRCYSKLIQASLKHLHESSDKAPLVLTVIGEQSSAKSSLMNATFGCNFRVSAGRCTIGMYLSVVRWQAHTIVIFDTEGLMSLEESGSIFDNQMVSMAMLSSHLVLINHKGEFSSNLEHLIGMSFYAKLQIRSPLRPKLLFVLRDQSDTGATGIFFNQLAKFKENLYNDSKFLKSSIDEELEINDQHVILLTNAFSNDFHPILEVEQTWRNSLFPMKINDLRSMVFNSLTDPSIGTYRDISQLYQKIVSNWHAIDKLGPSLLACKTLYELSMMNELRDLAHEIIEGSITAINNEGRQHIDRILADITYENYGNLKEDNLINLFTSAIQATHEKILQKAIADYQLKTERSCFPAEIKYKVQKLIEPPILNMQGLLREDFDERLHKTYRDARVSSAQRCLIDTVQNEFDRNMMLSIEQLQARVETVYDNQLGMCQQALRQDVETPDQIISKILKFYNSFLQSKQANTTRSCIYNLLHRLEINQFRKTCQQINETWRYLTKYEQSQQDNVSVWKLIKKFLRGKFLGDHGDDILYGFYQQLERWFQNTQDFDRNKKLLLKIVEELLPQMRDEVTKLIDDHFRSSSSDPRIINHVFAIIENLFNHGIIRDNRGRLTLHCFISDVAVIALEVLIDESIKSEQQRSVNDIEKTKKDMIEWKERISMQVQHMQNSFEQGRNMADIVSTEIFKEIGRILLDKILHEITENIAKSQFINHEAVQKQAYEESFGQGNGEKILKYVLDINRYFLELSLREINTKLEAILHMHIMNAEEIILRVFTAANDVAQFSKHDNTRLIADEIEKAIIDIGIPSLTVDNKFTIVGVMSLSIQNLTNFKQGFKTILASINNIQDEVAKLTQDVKSKAYIGCKTRISRRLGCQSRCPRCGSKCSRPEPHDDELMESWYKCQCATGHCECDRPIPQPFNVHGTPYHIAQAFGGMRYYKVNTPTLELCYQRWKTGSIFMGDDTEIFPNQKFYNEYHPQWYNNLHLLSTEGISCNEEIPPPEQRRAWMIVRHVLVPHYANYGMIDQEFYDKKFYPSNVDALPANFNPSWNDVNDKPTNRYVYELTENDDGESTKDEKHESTEDDDKPTKEVDHESSKHEEDE